MTSAQKGPLGPGLRLSAAAYGRMLAHAYDEFPNEMCGLLAGSPVTGWAPDFHPTENAAASSRVYTVSPKDHLRVDRAAEAAGLEIIGVVHSHTHTDAYPSPTDVQQAPEPSWHYVLVSLRDDHPVVRSYRIVDGEIQEEQVAVVG